MKAALVLGGALALAAVLSLIVGSVPLAPGDVLAALAGGGDATARTVVWQLRLPRTVLAVAVGGGLAVVGVAMQALVRNPLAEPYLLGTSSGASAGASVVALVAGASAWAGPLAAVAGAWLATAAVFVAARTGPALSTARLLLAGVALSALLGAVTAFATYAAPNAEAVRVLLFWLLGSLSRARWAWVGPPLVAALVATLALWRWGRLLDLLTTGEEPAASLGVPVERVKRLLIGLSAVVTGLIVAAAGIIGFVGLIVPHAVRLAVGAGHRRLVPLSFLAGAAFLTLADVVARTVLPGRDVPVGVVTALCGVPFFLALLRRAEM